MQSQTQLPTPQNQSFAQSIWSAARKDVFTGALFIPLYTLAEVGVAFCANSLLQLLSQDTPRIPIDHLFPHNVQKLLKFNQTLDRKEIIFILPACVIVLGFFKLVGSFFSSYFIERGGYKATQRLREDLLEKYLNAPGHILDDLHSDTIANGLVQDTNALQSGLSKGTLSLLRDGCVLIAMTLTVFAVNFWLAIQVFIAIIPMYYALKYISKRLDFYTKHMASLHVDMANRVLETHRGILTIFGLRSQYREIADFTALSTKLYDFVKESFLVRTLFRPATEAIAIVLLGAMLYYRLTHPEPIDVASYTIVAILLAMAFRPLKNLGNIVGQLTEMRVVYNRLHSRWEELSDTESQTQASWKFPVDIAVSAANIAIAEEVDYTSYQGTSILKNCSLQIPTGSKVVLLGESGAGKTTFLRILAGLLPYTKGIVRICKSRVLATQSPYLFQGSVMDNICYCNKRTPQMIDEVEHLILELELAHSQAGAQIFLNRQLGPMGTGLSGGESARVSLARALLFHPKVLLLDEPTANLDAKTAGRFWEYVWQWQKKDSERTVIAVSHSWQEVKDWDLCYVFAHGQIVQSGLPKEVLNH